jgi:hypothetical protein
LRCFDGTTGHAAEIKTLTERGFSKAGAMQKIAWKILWDGLGAELL